MLKGNIFKENICFHLVQLATSCFFLSPETSTKPTLSQEEHTAGMVGDQYHFIIVLLILLASLFPASFFSSAIIIIVVISHHATGPQQHFHNPLRHPCSYCGADGRRRVRRPLGDPSKLQAPHGHN